MLKQLPEVGQTIVALTNEYWENESQFQTAGNIYEIKGVSDVSGYPYFIGDLDEPVYIDDAAFDLYRSVESEIVCKSFLDDVSITLTKVTSEIETIENGFISKDILGKVVFEMSIDGDEDSMKAIAELESDIRRLLDDKYHG